MPLQSSSLPDQPLPVASAGRDLHLDLMRIAAALAVVLLHVSAQVLLTTADFHSLGWCVADVANTFARWAVPLFVMVSGALLLPGSNAASPLQFYRRRAGKILIPLLFWSAVYTLIRYFAEPESFTPAHSLLWHVLVPFIRGVPEPHLWFLFMIAGIYLVTPFLRIFVQHCPPKVLGSFVGVGFGLLVVYMLCSLLTSAQSPSEFFAFPFYLPYFVAGYALRNVSKFKVRPRWLILTIVGCVALVATAHFLLQPLMGEDAEGITYTAQDPLVILMTLAIFELIRSVPVERLTRPMLYLARQLPPVTLGVYLVHPLWILAVLRMHLNWLWAHPVLAIPVVTVFVFMASALTTKLMAAIPWLRATVV